jgi:hypothetical protein
MTNEVISLEGNYQSVKITKMNNVKVCQFNHIVMDAREKSIYGHLKEIVRDSLDQIESTH